MGPNTMVLIYEIYDQLIDQKINVTKGHISTVANTCHSQIWPSSRQEDTPLQQYKVHDHAIGFSSRNQQVL